MSDVPGVKVLLIGGTGTGKTYSIRTLVEAGVTPFIIFTEPGMEVLSDVPVDKCHWTYIPPIQDSIQSLLTLVENIGKFSLDSLAKMSDNTRSLDNRFLKIVQAVNNFTCERTGEVFGPAAGWDESRALVVDSLSGLGIAAMRNVIGNKPVASIPDWGLAQNQIEQFVNYCCMNLKCHFALIAHAEREVDEVLGGSQIMAATLGRKLAPKLPRFFSDVILAKREGTKYSWNTATIGVDLKARNLPLAEGQPPSFTTLISTWKGRQV